MLLIIPILAVILVSTPRSIMFCAICGSLGNLNRRRCLYKVRAVTSILLFVLSIIILVLLILFYKGTEIFEIQVEDAIFLASDAMKWTIILLAISVVVMTLFDLYFSLAVRTFYLNLAIGYENPDVQKQL